MARPTITFDTLLNQQGAIKGARDLRDKLAGRPVEIKLSTKSLAQPLGRITGDVAEFTKSLQAATARVTAFGATSGAIFLVSKGISELAKSVVEVDKQLTELNTFLGQSQGQLQKFGSSLFDIAKNTASSFENVAEAAKEFARQGLSAEETLKRTSDALVLSRISGLGAAESVNALTTAINSFNKSGLTSTDIVNKLVKVDSNFAVSSNDLAQALTRVGSAAQDSGVGFEQLIAAVTAAQQTTGRGGAVIGNAFKTIFTRLKRPEILSDLEALGVAVKDQNGFLLDGISILTNYAQATKNLSQVEKARTDELLGGVFQINQLKALTSDLAKVNGIYARSVEQANNATDEATKKNEELNKSMSSLIARTTANFQKKGGSFLEPLLRPTLSVGAGLADKLLDTVAIDKTKASEEGVQTGQMIAQGLLKGIGQAISGPGLVLVSAIVFKIGQRLSSFLVDASKVLLDLKSSAANVQSIEQAINNTLAQQPKLTQAVLAGQISREQAASQLLELFRQQNQQLVIQRNLASSLAQKFSTSGYVASPEFGIYQARGGGKRSSGYMPEILRQEKSEAISKGASSSVVPYFAEAVIGGRKQVIAANSGETLINNFAGGSDTAIIPNYIDFDKVPRKSSGYIPMKMSGGNNPSRQVITINSLGGLRKAIENNKQKFFSIQYETEPGRHETLEAQKDTFQFGPSVRKDEYKGAEPPSGFNTWREQRLARNLISVRSTNGERKTLRLDRIIGVNAGGFTFTPSAQLAQAMGVTSSFSSAKLRRQGVEDVGEITKQAIQSGATIKSLDLKGASASEARKRIKDYLSQYKQKRARGYVPNFATIPPFRSPPPLNFPKPTPRIQGPEAGLGRNMPQGQDSLLGSSISEMVRQAIFFAVPSILSSSVAARNNEGLTSGILGGSAVATGLYGTIKGFRQRGLRGGISGLAAAGVTGVTAYSQIQGLKENVKMETFQEARDKATDVFNKLTTNVGELSDSIGNLENFYSDPNVKPEALAKLAKKQEELLNKLSAVSPETALKVRGAATPQAKLNILSEFRDTEARRAAVAGATLDFTQLNTAKRDVASVSKFFSDISTQLDKSKINVFGLTTKNLGEALTKGGAGGARTLFETQGKDFQNAFIDFLKGREKLDAAQAETQLKLNAARKPLIDLQVKAEKRQGFLKAEETSRLSFLQDLSKVGQSFGDNAGISIAKDIDVYLKSRSERQVFSRRMATDLESLGAGPRNYLSQFQGMAPGKELEKRISSAIAVSVNPKDILILENLLATSQRSFDSLQNIKDQAEIQAQRQKELVDIQNKIVNYGGGMKTSLDASSKLQAAKDTQRGALQYQLGSLFGSKETQVAGLGNFVETLKNQFPGIFDNPQGQAILGGVNKQLIDLRTSDLSESLQRNASLAASIGQGPLANLLMSQSNPAFTRGIAQMQVGTVTGKYESDIFSRARRESEGADVFAGALKRQSDREMKLLEEETSRKGEAISSQYQQQVSAIETPIKEGIQKLVGSGLKIDNANLIAASVKLDISKVFSGNNEEAKSATPVKAEEPNRAGGPTPAEMTRARNMAVVREQNALSARGVLGIPNFASSRPVATISRGFSPELVSKSNPAGEAIINSIDEPLGMASLGKKSFRNFSSGFIPNFAKKTDQETKFKALAEKYSLSMASELAKDLLRPLRYGQTTPYGIESAQGILADEFAVFFDSYLSGQDKQIQKELKELKNFDPELREARIAVNRRLSEIEGNDKGQKIKILVSEPLPPIENQPETPPKTQAKAAKPTSEAQRIADQLKKSGAIAKLSRPSKEQPAETSGGKLISKPKPASVQTPESKAAPKTEPAPEPKLASKPKTAPESKPASTAKPISIKRPSAPTEQASIGKLTGKKSKVQTSELALSPSKSKITPAKAAPKPKTTSTPKKIKKKAPSLPASGFNPLLESNPMFYDEPVGGNLERLMTVGSKRLQKALTEASLKEKYSQISNSRKRASRPGVPLKSYKEFWEQNVEDFRKYQGKQSVEGQYLLDLLIPGDPKTGRFPPTVKSIVEGSLKAAREKELENQSLEKLKKEIEARRIKEGRALSGPVGQLPLFEQEREGGQLFGKGTGKYVPAKGLNYLSVAQAEQNKLAEERKIQLEAEALTEKLLNDYEKRNQTVSEDVLAARRKSIFGQTPEERERAERGLFEQQYRELERKDAADKAAFERDYKKLERQEARAAKRKAMLEAGTPLTGRRAARGYDNNPNNIKISDLIKNTLLRSGLGENSIKAITGLTPNEFKKLSPSGLQGLMEERGIILDLENQKAFKTVSGELAVTERDFHLDLTKSKLSPEEAEIVRRDILKKTFLAGKTATGEVYTKAAAKFNITYESPLAEKNRKSFFSISEEDRKKAKDNATIYENAKIVPEIEKRKPINAEAQALLDKLDKGASRYEFREETLKRIAKDNGINVNERQYDYLGDNGFDPEDSSEHSIIKRLRRKAFMADEGIAEALKIFASSLPPRPGPSEEAKNKYKAFKAAKEAEFGDKRSARFISNLKLATMPEPVSTKGLISSSVPSRPREDGLFTPKSIGQSIKNWRNKNAINNEIFQGGILELLGYRSKDSINKSAEELLKLEEKLSAYDYPEETKNSKKEDFLRKQGPFADAILAASDKIAAERDAAKLREALGFGIPEIDSKNPELTVLESLMEKAKQAVNEGKLTPEQATDLYFKAARDKGATPGMFSSIAPERPNLATFGGVLGEILKPRIPTLEDAMFEAQQQRDKSIVTEKIRRAGVEKMIQTSKGLKKMKIPFGVERLNAIKEILGSDMSPEEKRVAVEDIRETLGIEEIEKKQEIARKYGFEYDPLKDEAMTKLEAEETRKALKDQEINNKKTAEAAMMEHAPEKPSRARRLGKAFMPGLMAGLSALGAVSSGAEIFQGMAGKEKLSKSEYALLAGEFLGSTAAAIGGGAEFFQALGYTGGKAEKISNLLGGSKGVGAAFGLAGAAGASLESLRDFREGNIGSGLSRLGEAGLIGGGGIASALGQKVMEQRLFGAAAFMGLAAEIAKAENFQIATVSDADLKTSVLEKIGYGALQTLTGQSIDQNFKAGKFLMDSLGLVFTGMMGNVGAAAVTAKLGYRVGNIIEQQIGLGNRLGSFLAGGEFRGAKAASGELKTEGFRPRSEFESDAAYKQYLMKLQEEESGMRDKAKRNQIIAAGMGALYVANPGLGVVASSLFSNGFIPNFALTPSVGRSSFGFTKTVGGFDDELNAIKTSPDYAGYRNAMPIPTPPGVPKGTMNSAEGVFNVQDVYGALFGPFGSMMKPQNPAETMAILNPAQQRALGMNAAGGFVPNFSNEQFASMLSEAMKNGMSAMFANGFIPSPSSSNSINIYDNRNIQNSMEGNISAFNKVVGVLKDMFPKEMATIGPEITQIG